jgi:hypothetical protein
MLSLISSTKRRHRHRVCASKQELFEVLEKLYDTCIEKGCDYFDLVIDTDVDYEQED